jgi:hypothetical protein
MSVDTPRRVLAERTYGPYRDTEGTKTFVMVELSELPTGTLRVSFTGETYLKHSRHLESWGQSQGSAPLALVALWDQWHLNDMRAGCKHQEARYRATPSERPTYTNGYTGTAGDTLSGPCSECGYKYGTAWLFEPLPVDILDQCDAAAKVVA